MICNCLNLVIGKEINPWVTFREKQRELLQASGARSRLIHGAGRLFWAESHQGCIWHDALDQEGNLLLSWESITSLDLPMEKSGSSGKELEDRWISWRLSLSILTVLSICENGIICNFSKRTTLLLCGTITTENRYYVCFLAHLYGGSKFYLIYRWFWEITIVRVFWGTQGALVATITVFILLPFCTVYYTEANLLSQFGIPLVQWFTSSDLQSVMVRSPAPWVSKPNFFVIRFKFTRWEFADPLEGPNPKRMETTGLRGPLASTHTSGCKPETLRSAFSHTWSLQWSQCRVV